MDPENNEGLEAFENWLIDNKKEVIDGLGSHRFNILTSDAKAAYLAAWRYRDEEVKSLQKALGAVDKFKEQIENVLMKKIEALKADVKEYKMAASAEAEEVNRRGEQIKLLNELCAKLEKRILEDGDKIEELKANNKLLSDKLSHLKGVS